MKLKSILITTLSLSLLVACQSEEENITEPTSTPSMEENTKKTDTEQAKTIMKEPNSNVEEATEPEPEQLPSQTIQQEPGETQKDYYYTIENDAVQYIQTGDAFLIDSEIHEGEKVLVIPFKFKNKTSEEAIKPSEPLMILTQAFQMGDDVNYQIFSTTYANQTYKNDSSISVNKDGEIDYLRMYELKDPSLGLQILDKQTGTVLADFVHE